MTGSGVDNPNVSVVTTLPSYPDQGCAPYHPSEHYPELRDRSLNSAPNHAYRAVRQVLGDLGLDKTRFGQPDWNPIGDLVKPGANIVVKPNWVQHRNSGTGGMDCMVTHPAIIRAVLDFVFLARPAGVVLGDAPLQGCQFGRLMQFGYQQVTEYFQQRQLPLRCADFRRTVISERGRVAWDVQPIEDYFLVDLGERSFLEPISGDADKFRVTVYDPRKMSRNHRPGHHQYCIAREVLEADLVVNLPKLKTHKKAGITASLKNLVGINGNKEFLPHHRKGSRDRGGDNYETYSGPKAMAEYLLDLANMRRGSRVLSRSVEKLASAAIRWDRSRGRSYDVEGSWYGNDTVWRMCLDLNRVLFYATKEAKIEFAPQRAEISIQDAIIAGQGEGPLAPDPYPLGMVIAGCNPAATDWVAALLLGMDPARIPLIAQAFAMQDDLPVASFGPEKIRCTFDQRETDWREVAEHGRHVRLPAGWVGHCEIDARADCDRPAALR